MASASATFDSVVADIAAGRPAPLYVLHGDEGYYIDELVKRFEGLVPEDEREFNLYTFYAPQTDPGQITDVCMGVPMMAERQVVIVKEAQAARADRVNRLHLYAQRPQASTVLVICFRGAQAKGKDLLAAVRRNGGVIFESKRLTDYALGGFIGNYVKRLGMSADAKAVDMLRDFVGNDLSRLAGELDKLAGILGKGAAVTPEAVERYIGVSKDFNAFELVDALAMRDAARVYRITEYFRSNPKANPLVMVTASIFAFFADLLVAYYTTDKSERGLMESLHLRAPFQLKRYRTGMASYNAFQVIEIIDAIRDFDGRSKGVGSRQNEHALFRELMHHILTAPGRLPC